MKIEKISDNQIRCTLDKQDLKDRQLRLSELAYGTEKAKALFQDMIQQASYEVGFEAEDIPLMIEAIPVSPECLVLIITKVEDPDELDTRFSRFSPDNEINEFSAETDEDIPYADEILHCFEQLHEIIDNYNSFNDEDDLTDEDDEDISIEIEPLKEKEVIPSKTIKKKKETLSKKASNKSTTSANTMLTKVFSFDTLNDVIQLSSHIVYFYQGVNTLYKDTSCGKYYLVVSKSEHSPEEFNKICNMISEYGKSERTTYASQAYYEEHFEIIAKQQAIQVLSTL